MNTGMKLALLPIRRRMRLKNAQSGMVWGLLAAGGGGLLLAAAAFLWPLSGVRVWMLLLTLAAPLVGALAGAAIPVRMEQAARRADACGLHARAETALTLAGDSSPMATLQRKDAEARVMALDARAAVPLRVSAVRVSAAAGALLVAFAITLLPNPQNDTLRARAEFEARMQAEAERAEKQADETLKEDPNERDNQELARILKEMAERMRDAKDAREALAAVSQAEESVQRVDRDRITAAQNAMNAEGLNDMADAMSEGGMQQALESALAEMGAQALENALSEAAQSAGESGTQAGKQAASALSAAAGAISQGSLSGASQALSSLNSAASLAALLAQARAAASGAGQGKGAQGMGAGQGAGQGTGQGTSGAGQGSTQQDQGEAEGMNAHNGTGQGHEFKLGEYESIYDPERLGGDSPATSSTGEVTEGESAYVQLGPGAGVVSGSVPYSQVVGGYRDSAAQAADSAALGERERNMITRYFDFLIQ